MYYSTRRGYLNIILLVITLLALMVLVAWLAFQAGGNAAEGRLGNLAAPKVIGSGANVTLTTISLAQNAGLSRASGAAIVDRDGDRIELDVVLPDRVTLPEASVMQGWLVDAGRLGGLGRASVSDADQKYGTPFANVDFTERVNDAPYAVPLGQLEWDGVRESLHLFYEGSLPLAPFDAIMVTLESDGNSNDYDPRPGTPILIGVVPK